MNYYELFNKFPAPSDTFEEAMKIEINVGTVEYDVSAFGGYCLLLIFYLDNRELYEGLQEFLQIKLQKVSKCVWFLRKDEELKFYEYCFPSLEVMICHYYSYISRVKFILEEEE